MLLIRLAIISFMVASALGLIRLAMEATWGPNPIVTMATWSLWGLITGAIVGFKAGREYQAKAIMRAMDEMKWDDPPVR